MLSLWNKRRVIEWIKENGNTSKKGCRKNPQKNGCYKPIAVLPQTKDNNILDTNETPILLSINDNWNEELPDKLIDKLLKNTTENQHENSK